MYVRSSNAWIPLGGDTGWVDIEIAAGFSPTNPNERPQVRRIGKIVYIRGALNSTGMSAGSTFNVGTIPSGFAPVVNVINGIGSSVGAAVASGFISASGSLQVRTSPTLGAYYTFGGLSWPID